MQLYYVYDPMCSWCWGFSKTFFKLVEKLPQEIKLTKLLGGLAPDNQEEMPKQMQAYLQKTWQQVQHVTGASFNFDFWVQNTPKRSTYMACRAVLAAGERADAMAFAISYAYYQRALNPSELSVLIQLAKELSLDEEVFKETLVSSEIEACLQENLEQTRQLGVQGFPSLVLEKGGVFHPIRIDFKNEELMLEQIQALK